MKLSARRIAGTTFAASLAAVPLSTLAVTSESSGYHEYRIQLVDGRVQGMYAGAQTGELKLRYGAGGIVNGYYRADDTGPFVAIDGTRDGSTIDLEFADTTLRGTFDHGAITGAGFEGDREVDFTATPDAGNGAPPSQ